MSILALLDHVCTVYRATPGADVYGDVSGAFAAQATPERLALVPPKLRTANYGPGAQPAGVVEGYMRPAANVVIADILDVTAGPEAPSKWRVQFVLHPRGHHTELILEPYTGAIA